MRIVVQEPVRRLDKFLFEKIGNDLGITRSALAQYIDDYVTVNGQSSKKGRELKAGDVIKVDEKAIQSSTLEKKSDHLEGVEGPLNIIDESDEYIVLNKAKGVAVHPGKGNESNTVANHLKYYLQSKGEYDPALKRGGIVHRLDKLVGGILLCAKTRKMQLFLQEKFEKREVSKLYLATVEKLSQDIPQSESLALQEVESFRNRGYKPDGSWIKVEGYIQRSITNRMKMELTDSKGKHVLSYVKVLKNNEVLVNIMTGRMHQIRASMNKLGWVIVGDKLYGSSQGLDGIALSQILLSVQLPNGKKKEWNLI